VHPAWSSSAASADLAWCGSSTKLLRSVAAARGVSQHELVLQSRRRARHHRSLAHRLQRTTPAQLSCGTHTRGVRESATSDTRGGVENGGTSGHALGRRHRASALESTRAGPRGGRARLREGRGAASRSPALRAPCDADNGSEVVFDPFSDNCLGSGARSGPTGCGTRSGKPGSLA